MCFLGILYFSAGHLIQKKSSRYIESLFKDCVELTQESQLEFTNLNIRKQLNMCFVR